MKVDHFAFMVGSGHEVALLPLGVFLGIVFRFGQPLFASLSQIISNHPGQVGFVGQTEYGRLRCLRRDMGFQTRRQLGLNVLPSVFPVFRRSGFAGDVGRFGIEVRPASGKASQFVRSQPGLDRRAVQQ